MSLLFGMESQESTNVWLGNQNSVLLNSSDPRTSTDQLIKFCLFHFLDVYTVLKRFLIPALMPVECYVVSSDASQPWHLCHLTGLEGPTMIQIVCVSL